jgi:K+-transporting ATPase A subunit
MLAFVSITHSITIFPGPFLTAIEMLSLCTSLGKKIGPLETKFVTLYVLACPLAVLAFTALAVAIKAGLAGLVTNHGAHGFTEILYAYASCFANNGQSFAGLNANSHFYNWTTAVVMMMGRFGLAIPALALAGLLAGQIKRQEAANAVPTDKPINIRCSANLHTPGIKDHGTRSQGAHALYSGNGIERTRDTAFWLRPVMLELFTGFHL